MQTKDRPTRAYEGRHGKARDDEILDGGKNRTQKGGFNKVQEIKKGEQSYTFVLSKLRPEK